MPAHPPSPQALIRAAGLSPGCRSPSRQPLHRTFHPTPTGADHVRRSLGSDVDLILDGGPCRSASNPPSSRSPRSSANPSSPRHHSTHGAGINHRSGRPRPRPSNGAHHRPRGCNSAHYSPRTPSVLNTTNGNIPEHGQGIYLQHEHAPSRTGGNVAIHQMPQSAPDYAAALYEVLHRADAGNYDWIAVDVPPSSPIWDAHPGPTETSRLEFLIPNSLCHGVLKQPLLPSLGLFRITRCNS